MSSLYLRGNYSVDPNLNLQDFLFQGKIKILDDTDFKSENSEKVSHKF